ncbi:MAG: DMT family transporter [Lachnospiraceae bacterium]|nr:DMT family transporter [Lachnospiraceae bacterium]
MKEKKNSISGVLFLLAGAVVWGTTFVAQDTAADQMGAFTYLFGRSIVAVVFLGILILVLDRVGKVTSPPTSRAERGTLWQGGILVGVFCCLASWLQQYGIAFTTAGKAGFLTAFYIVLVPVIGIFLGRRPTIFLSLAIVLALIGLYFLSLQGGLHLQKGDALILLCALVFSIQILCVDRYAGLVDGVRLSFIQFLTITVICFVCMFLFEKPSLSILLDGWLPILYAGILSSGVGYTFQILGQSRVNPALASILMSLESVFSAISGALILHERMSPREILGCCLVFSAVILAQLPTPGKKAS